MHVRFSTVIGTPIVEESTEEAIGMVSSILINPDLGKIEGFFVRAQGFLHSEELFLSTFDIRHWGSRIRVRDTDVLSPIHDLIRLQSLIEERRPILGQRILTESNAFLGTCKDVQLDTTAFMLEWIFPKKFWRWAPAIPASSIVLVRADAVVVRDAVTLPETAAGPSVLTTLDPLATTAPGTMQYKE